MKKNIFESTFEKHKKLVLEAVASAEETDKAKAKAASMAAKKEKKTAEEIENFDPTSFWNDFKEMPVSSFVRKYGNVFKDEKLKKFLNMGTNDGDEIEKFSVNKVTLPVSKLQPSQNQIGFGNSLDDLCKETFDPDQQLKELADMLKGVNVSLGSKGNPTGDFIMIYDDKYIIDGHHRWSKIACANKNATAACINFKSTGATLDPEQVLKAFHLAIAADRENMPGSPQKGKNLIGGNKDAVKSHVQQILEPDFLEVYKKHDENLNTPEKIGIHIADNAAAVVIGAKPATNTPRYFMPQTDTSTQVQDKLQSGEINFAPDEKSKQLDEIFESTFKKFKNLYAKKI